MVQIEFEVNTDNLTILEGNSLFTCIVLTSGDVQSNFIVQLETQDEDATGIIII